jgi:subtilisin family serine protease
MPTVQNAFTAYCPPIENIVRVGIVDSGWDRRLGDSRVLAGVSFVDNMHQLHLGFSEDDNDRNGHGTVCASIILEIAPECRVVPIRVFGVRTETSVEVLVAAVDWATAQGIRVLNLSLGTLHEDLMHVLYRACERARRAGVVIVAAVHAGADEWSYPAVFDPVIGVGAANLDDPFTIRYTQGAAVECAVRTSQRRARGLAGRDVLVSGTSYAAPVVTGLIARWLQRSPGMDLDAVRSRFSREGPDLSAL